DGAGEDLFAMVAGAVADDRELKVIRVVVQLQVGPGIARLGLDLKLLDGGIALGRRKLREGDGRDEDGCRGCAHEQSFHEVSWRGCRDSLANRLLGRQEE